MGCGKKSDFKGKSCVCEVVRAIKDIQDNAEEDVCECPSNCFLEPLGAISPTGNRKHSRPDTRVIVLSTADGAPFHAFFKGNECACVSIFFRVEEVFDNCCAVLRVLEPLHRKSGPDKTVNLADDCCIDLKKVCEVDNFRSTNDCVTCNLNNFTAVQCIADVNLGICQ